MRNSSDVTKSATNFPQSCRPRCSWQKYEKSKQHLKTHSVLYLYLTKTYNEKISKTKEILSILQYLNFKITTLQAPTSPNQQQLRRRQRKQQQQQQQQQSAHTSVPSLSSSSSPTPSIWPHHSLEEFSGVEGPRITVTRGVSKQVSNFRKKINM